MTDELYLRRKWTFSAHGERHVFYKKSNENTSHVLMKAFLWALYLPDYPRLAVEISIGDRFKPDLVSLDDHGSPELWCECGRVSPRKITALARKLPETRLVISKWATSADAHEKVYRKAIRGLRRRAPFELLVFPDNAADQFIQGHGEIQLEMDAIEQRLLHP